MEEKRRGLWGGVAKALNATGAATLKSFDYTVDLFSKTTNAVTKATPGIVESTVDVSRRTADFIVSGLSKMGQFTKDINFGAINFGAINFGKMKLSSLNLDTDKDDLRDKITEYEGKIKNLYFEIGKEGASADQVESDKVRKMIEDVKDYEKEIQRLKGRILELEDLKRQEHLRKPESRKEPKVSRKKQKLTEAQVDSLLKSSIDKALRHGTFETDSDKAIFNKIANDLLDMEMDVKILAATELGKMGNRAAADVLLDAVRYDNQYLSAEAINSLINIGDPKAVALCKEMSTGANHKVRCNSLRGLYKLGKEDEILPYLMEALRDEHAEVRRTAVTFLGWKDCKDAVPGLVQSLQDKDEHVRKSAVSALANIKDRAAVLPLMTTLADEGIEIRQKSLEAIKMITAKDVAFNIELTGEALAHAVNELKNWWQRERMDGISEEVVEQYADVVPPETRPAHTSYSSHYAQSAQEHDDESAAPSRFESPEAVAEAVESAASEIADSPESDQLSETVALPVSAEETGSEREPASVPSQSELKRMSKAELISVCEAQGIECDDTYIKSELINLLNV